MSTQTALEKLTYEVELNLIGSLLKSQLSANARTALDWVRPEMFATFKLGQMFDAIRRQALRDNLIDMLLLETDFGLSLSELAEVYKNTISSANLLGYAERLVKLYQRREAQKIFLSVSAELNHARDEKLDEITAKGLSHLSALMQKQHKIQPLAMDDLLDGYLALLDERSQPNFKNRLLFTGVEALDAMLGGINDTDICIIAGRAGNGKTETAITFTKNIIEAGGSVLFFSLEMSRNQIMDRLIASASGVNSAKLRNPEYLSDEDFAKVTHALSPMREQRLFIVDKSGLTCDELISIAEGHIQAQGRVNAVVIDYVGLIRHGALDGRINRTYQIGETMEKLKTFCKDNHTPLFLLAQLNRNADGSRPSNADLRDSGSLEQDASQIIMVHNQRDKESGEPHRFTEWIVTKNRFGKVGTAYVSFDNGRFVECDQAQAWEAFQKPQAQPKSYGSRPSGYGV